MHLQKSITQEDTTSFISLAWPDPVFEQGRYCFEYKRPVTT